MSNYLLKISTSQSEASSLDNNNYYINISILIKNNSILYKQYKIEKTYFQFEILNKRLKKNLPTPKFPIESFFSSKKQSEKQVNARIKCLNEYMEGVLRIPNIIFDLNFRIFLGIDENFYDEIYDNIDMNNEKNLVGIEWKEEIKFKLNHLSIVYCDYKYNEDSIGYYCICFEQNKKEYIRILKYCNKTKSFLIKSEDFFIEEKILSMSSTYNNINKDSIHNNIRSNDLIISQNNNKIYIIVTTKSGFVYILEYNQSFDYIKQIIKFEAHKKIKSAFFYSSSQMIITSIGMKNIKLWKCDGMKLEDKIPISNPICIEYDNKKKYLFIGCSQCISIFIITKSKINFINKTTTQSKNSIVYIKYINQYIDNNESIFVITQGKTKEISILNISNQMQNMNNISIITNETQFIKCNSYGYNPLFIFIYKDILYVVYSNLNISFYIISGKQWRLIYIKNIWKEEEINDESIFVDVLNEDRLLIYSNTYKCGIVIYINDSFVNIKYSIINIQNENDNKVLDLYKSKTINNYLDVSKSILKNDNQMNINEISTKKNMSMDESGKKSSLDQVFNFLNELN